MLQRRNATTTTSLISSELYEKKMNHNLVKKARIFITNITTNSSIKIVKFVASLLAENWTKPNRKTVPSNL